MNANPGSSTKQVSHIPRIILSRFSVILFINHDLYFSFRQIPTKIHIIFLFFLSKNWQYTCIECIHYNNFKNEHYVSTCDFSTSTHCRVRLNFKFRNINYKSQSHDVESSRVNQDKVNGILIRDSRLHRGKFTFVNALFRFT